MNTSLILAALVLAGPLDAGALDKAPQRKSKLEAARFVGALCAGDKLLQFFRPFIGLMTYEAPEQAAKQMARDKMKEEAVTAVRSTLWSRLKKRLPAAAGKTKDGVSKVVSAGKEGIQVASCAVMAEKMASGELATYDQKKQMLVFDEAKFQAFMDEETASLREGEVSEAFVNAYEEKLTASYTGLKCTYYGLFVPKNRKEPLDPASLPDPKEIEACQKLVKPAKAA